MKKLFYYFLICCTTVLLFSCNKDEDMSQMPLYEPIAVEDSNDMFKDWTVCPIDSSVSARTHCGQVLDMLAAPGPDGVMGTSDDLVKPFAPNGDCFHSTFTGHEWDALGVNFCLTRGSTEFTLLEGNVFSARAGWPDFTGPPAYPCYYGSFRVSFAEPISCLSFTGYLAAGVGGLEVRVYDPNGVLLHTYINQSANIVDANISHIEVSGEYFALGNLYFPEIEVTDPDWAMNLDRDEDGVVDACYDNCIGLYNPDQTDSDTDGLGDACDECPYEYFNDYDEDGLCASVDNCQWIYNPDQTDSDGDGVGDPCDNCPSVYNPDQLNSDGDEYGVNLGDACDPCPFDWRNDYDEDGLCADVDNCQWDSNPDQANHDGDELGDVCDDDDDNDGCLDDDDPHPFSIVGDHVVIDGCDSGVSNIVFDNGCTTLMDLIHDCQLAANSHGDFVSCVDVLTDDLKNAGELSGREKGAIQSCVARSSWPLEMVP